MTAAATPEDWVPYFIGEDQLVEARGRLKPDPDLGDLETELFDRCLTEIQTLPVRRRAVCEYLLSLVGLEPSDHTYREVMFPYDPPGRWSDLSTKSSCGWTRECSLRQIRCSDLRLYRSADRRGAQLEDPTTPGKDYQPITLEQEIARPAGGLVSTSTWAANIGLPTPGDGWVIGCKGAPGVWSKGTGNFEHIFTPFFFEETDEGPIVVSVDGGQPGIHIRRRRIVYAGDELWLSSVDKNGHSAIDADGRPAKGRRSLEYMNLDCIPLVSDS